MQDTPDTTSLLVEAAFKEVDRLYDALLSKKIISPRPQQIALSKQIAESIFRKEVLLSEAPTGTGKSLAYLIGGLAVNKVSPSKPQIIVATATKALQSQLIFKDVPKLVDANIVGPSDYGLAKGKSNYLCLKRATETLDLLKQYDEDPSETLLDDNSLKLSTDEVSTMLDAFDKNLWNGDFDSFTHFKIASNKALNVVGDQCNNRKCQYYQQCAYFRALDTLSEVKFVVSNHDLVLRDLQLESEGLVSSLGKQVPSYIAIFDEAHHLPAKAIAVGQTDGRLTALYEALPKLAGLKKIIESTPVIYRAVVSADVDIDKITRKPIDDPLTLLADDLSLLEFDSDNNHRFKLGVIPSAILAKMERLMEPVADLANRLEKVISAVSSIEPSDYSYHKEAVSEVIRRSSDVKNIANPVAKSLFICCDENSESAKWISSANSRLSVLTSPLEGAEVLKPLLWKSEKVSAVSMISATLQDVKGFNRFAVKAGVPTSYKSAVLPYIFPYDQSTLFIAGMKATPKYAERQLFERELLRKIGRYLDPSKGNLVLFPSWAMLKSILPAIKAALGDDAVLVQGEYPISALVDKHCLAIDQGLGSTLVGVASLSEGLDLPDVYCEAVHVVTMPFSAPTDPVEQEVADRLGSRYFGDRSLPDATTALVQMVGRLLRRESDRGTVYVYDRRLVSTSFGVQMLKALPPFKKVVEPIY